MSNKKLDKLEIKKEEKLVFGPYTLVSLESASGLKGFGLSRKSILDRQDPDLGYKIARGRAKKSLYYKVNKVKDRERSVFIA